MRIIAGAYKGRNLKSPPSLNVRPTSDRLRETLFNVIAPRIEDARFLDLCAGSGAVGIEALSRGASHVTFVDRSRRMCKLIEANVELCRIPEEQWDIYCSEANEFLRQSKDERGTSSSSILPTKTTISKHSSYSATTVSSSPNIITKPSCRIPLAIYSGVEF